jgi:O-antigen ligase
VTDYAGTLSQRERDGAIVLVLLALVMATAAAVQRVLGAEERPGPLLLPRWAPLAVLGLVVAAFVVALAFGSDERTSGPLSPGARRYATLTSNRYAYWKVALKAFDAQPVRGVGAEGWAVWWRRERTVAEGAHDAHSLYVQTAAELGVIGLALLAVWLAGVVLASREALHADGQAAAGLVAAVATWAAHVAIDWDFQMPAVTLPAILCMGALLTVPRRRAAPRA